ncbi:MAG: sarcosine oxidase subunit gamma [Geminicoccaceae bacterium]
MPEAIARRSALEPRLLQPRGVRLAERGGLGKLDLRGDPTDRAFMAAVGRCLDLLLPTEPDASAAKGTVTALWAGPDHWLLTCPASAVAALMERLRDALEGAHAAITEVTDGRIALRLAGPNARDVLAKGCPVDLHVRAFAAGRCTQSLLAKASVLIHLVEDDPRAGPAFDVYVARSFSHYVFAWLEDAGREHGVQIDPAG